MEFPGEFVARNARAADLIIAGGQAGRADTTRQIDPGDLALRAGRPVLVVPSDTEFLKLACVVVAWKDTREARRAVVDALPLLHIAREVLVVELLAPDEDQAAAKSRVDDVAHWLERRGISASSIATKALIGVTDRLTILAQDEGAGVIVAGAYGHPTSSGVGFWWRDTRSVASADVLRAVKPLKWWNSSWPCFFWS